MKQIITAKLKLQTDPIQFAALRATQLAYRDALNHVSRYSFAHGKTSNRRALQKACYDEIRLRFGLPTQMACNVPRQVGASYQTLWTKAKHNAQARKAGWTKKRYKGLDQPPRYISPTVTYNYQRDYSFKKGQRVSILTLQGRVVLAYRGYDKHVALIGQGAVIGGAKLRYDTPHKQFYLLVSLELELPDPTLQAQRQVMGVDVGQRYLAVTATPSGHASFYSGKQSRARADHYARLRKRLQKKGTRSATRRLRVISGRERRLKQERNHLISRRVVDAHPQSLIGLEELTHIRERSRRRRGKKASRRQRRANRHSSSWAFAELHEYIAYKARFSGSLPIKVDAYLTSQTCPRCGFASEDNRPNHGLLFACQQCGYQLHADLIGARNVLLRTLLTRQDWVRTGSLSVSPDVSCEEAKAQRRQRFRELRWSAATSLRL